MSYGDLCALENTIEQRSKEKLHRARTGIMLRQAGIVQRRWLPQQGCWLLCQLGHLLMALGERLQQYGLPQPLPLDGEPAGSG